MLSQSQQQQLFKQFLNLRGYAANTVNAYYSGVNTISNHWGQDVYACSDLTALNDLLERYGRGGEFANIGSSNSANVIAGLTQWVDFQTELQQAEAELNNLRLFLQRWPPASLPTMTVEQYAAVGTKSSFCYELEFGITAKLGSIRGGSAAKFGLYERVCEPKGERGGITHGERYSWKTKYGQTMEQAFATIKQRIMAIVAATQAGELDAIEAIDFEPALKWKLAFLYQHHEQPTTTAIYSAAMLQTLSGAAADTPCSLMQRQLLAQRAEMPIYLYSRLCWQSLKSTDKNDDADFEGDDALEKRDAKRSPLNQILFGPPGTGKTYHTINKALEILAPEVLEKYTDNSAESRQRLIEAFDHLVAANKIRFVTFHQSFSYEDFVEGIRAETDATGQLRYNVHDGVFKELCNMAAARDIQHADTIDLSNRRIWKMSLGNTLGEDAQIFNECIKGNYVLLGYGDDIDFTGCQTREDVRLRFAKHGYTPTNPNQDYAISSVTTFVTRMKQGDLIVVSDGNLKLRAIAEVTGGYCLKLHPDFGPDYSQSRQVKWLRHYEPSLPYNELLDAKFSQMTLYELSVPTLNLEKLERLLGNKTSVTAAESAVTKVENGLAATDYNKRVLIIDEINRGNISRIFGELITLIEPSKRAGAEEALSVVLPYSKERFSVPNNVYLIGTMNTADRSLTGLDIALRRRFDFIEMPPQPELLQGVAVEGIAIDKLLHVINSRIEVLLGREYCIGHAYFMPLQMNNSLTTLADIFTKKVLPLLQEYFFDDWQRIAWVLNDHRKAADCQFVRQVANQHADLFGDIDLPLQATRWEINHAAFTQRDAYAGIIGAQPPQPPQPAQAVDTANNL